MVSQCSGAGTTQLVQRLSMGWTVRGSNPSGGEIFRTHSDQSWAHPASYTMGTGSFMEVKWLGRGIDHPTPSSAKVKKKSRVIPLIPLWALVALF
jgi:hypothetical protein